MPTAGQVMKPQVRRGRDPNECWQWLGPKTADGYGKKTFGGRCVGASRWLWQQLHGPIAQGRVIAHTCGDRGCVNPAHLRVTTQAEANRAGETATLVAGDVEDIRAQRGKQTAASLAEVYGVSAMTIRDVWRKSSWANAKPNFGPGKAA